MREEKLPRQEREMRRRGLNSSDRSFSGWTDGSYNYLKVQVFFFFTEVQVSEYRKHLPFSQL